MHGSKKNNPAIQRTVDLEPNLNRKRLFSIVLGLIAVAALCALASVFTDRTLVLFATLAVMGLFGYLLLIGWRKYGSATGKHSLRDFAYFMYDRTLLPLRFDEKYYLKAYPHVSDKIASGQYSSAIEHYRIAGRKLSFSYAGSAPVGWRRTVNDVPVAFFIFNRPALTQAVFDQIRRFAPTTLLVVADGPRDENEEHLCEEVRGIIKQVDWPCRVLQNFSNENLGCRKRMSSGLRWVFEQVEEAIILEDDCLPDPTFFPFCSNLLICYRDDPRVMQISGSCFLMQPCTEQSYWFSRHSDIWGWATWRRAFRHYDESMSSWPISSRLRRSLIWKDPIERRYWTRRFDDTHAGKIDTWDYQWHWNVYERNGRAIIPRFNLVTNLGHGVFATHTRDANIPTANLATVPIHEISHPPRFQRQPQADFEVFCARYYFEGHFARREGSVPAFRGPMDFIVTHDLPVFSHGVGALIQKVFQDSRSWANARSEDHHIRHKAPVPSLLIRCDSSGHPNRLATMTSIARALGESRLRSVLAVPYSDQDCLNALALSYLYRAPLRLWLMDDQNIHSTGISDSLMRELIENSIVRLAVCEEMRAPYEEKFGRPFEVQMPVERECDLVRSALPPTLGDPPKIASCGNVWCESTMRSLMAFTKTAGITIDWYGNLGNDIDHEELSASGIRVRGTIPHEDLIATLRTYDLAIVAMPDESFIDRAWQARLSFPSKIVTLFATANLPILFAGPKDNPGANFVRKNDLGETCGWAQDQFSAALARMLSIQRLTQIRCNAAALSGQFSASPVAERLWRGLKN